MSEHDARLVPAALGSLVACALVVADAVPWRSLAAALVAAAGSGAWVARRLDSSASTTAARVRIVAVGAAFACCVAAILAVGAGLRHEARIGGAVANALASRQIVSVSGTVTVEARPTAAGRFGGSDRWAARIEAHAIDGVPVRAPVRVVVANMEGLRLGAAATVEGRLSPSASPADAAVMWDAHVTASRPAHGPVRLVAAARDRIDQLTASVPPRLRGLTAGMVTGDDSAMPPDQREQMRRSGLAHLTAVSGAHFAVLTVAVVWAVRRRRVPRVVQAVAVACAAGAFTALVGPEPSVVRAASMAAVMALAIVLGRRARAVAALASGVLVLLALDPWVATSLGLCLSVAAVAAIAVWAPHLAVRLERWLVPRLARLVSVPLAAAGATAPLLVPVSGGIGLYAVPANLIAAPFAAPVTILGLLGLASDLLVPGTGLVLVRAASACAVPVEAAARAFATAPGAWLDWPADAAGAVMLAGVVALAVAATLARRVRGWGLAGAALACLGLLATPTVLAVADAPRLPDWDVIACDVGQGDMLLLRTGERSAAVIDTGPPGGGAAGCLRRHGIGRVELLVLTHPDADHDGDVAAVLGAVPVDRAWVSPVALDAPSTRALRAAGVPVDAPRAGTRIDIGQASLLVLASGTDTSAASDNDASIVLFASSGGATLLALGDLEREAQEALARDLGSPVVVDVVKIAHHGSANQSERLAGLVRARAGIVSVGAGNPYGHPTPSALHLYAPRVTALLRTDECGDILMAGGNGLRIASRCPAVVAG